jgi:hypothetical protein
MILPNRFQNDSAESFNPNVKSAAADSIPFFRKFIFNQGIMH